MIIDLEQKIMTKKRFSTAVEQLVVKGNMSYIDAATYIIEERGMDYSNLKKLLTDSLKDKMEAEAIRLNLIRGKKGNQLPIQENIMSNVIIPSSPVDVKRIKDCIIEISNAMTLIQGQKDFIKEAVESCCEDVEIDKKHLKKMSTIYHKQNLSEILGEIEDVEALYEGVMAQ